MRGVRHSRRVRPGRAWHALAFLGPLVLLAAAWREAAGGTLSQVRHGWTAWLPALLAFAGIAAVALALRRPRAGHVALGVAGAALASLVTHLALVLAVPLEGLEQPKARLWPALDILSFAALVAVVLVLARGGPRTRVLVAVLVDFLLVALVLARQLGLARSRLASELLTPGALTGALLAGAACVAAASVGGAMFMAAQARRPARRSR